MKLIDRHLVEGTSPAVYIGHKVFKGKDGKAKACKKYHAEYNHNGKKYDQALKTSNKEAAIREAHRIVSRIERGEVKPVHQRVEWQEMWDAYINFLRTKNRAPKTIEKYTYVLTCFMDFMRARKRPRPDTATAADFWAFNHQMMADKLHLKTMSDRLVIVKQWFKWATVKAKPAMLITNPIASEEVEDAESSPQPCFKPEQVEMLLQRADKDQEGPIFSVMAYLGLRFGEVRDLKWSDFDFDCGSYGQVHIQRGGSNSRTKGKTSRRIPLNGELRKVLDRLPRHTDGRVFHRRASTRYPNGDKPLSERRLLKALKRLCKRCKFDNPGQFKLHTFRHAFASMLARKRAPYKHALALMGHKDSRILDLYITIFDEDAEQAIASVTYSGHHRNGSSAASNKNLPDSTNDSENISQAQDRAAH